MYTATLKMLREYYQSIVLLLAMILILGNCGTLLAQPCCDGFPTTQTTVSAPVVSYAPVIVSKPVMHSAMYPAPIYSEPIVPTQTYRIETETEYREENETVTQQVWDTEVRERRYSVLKQVPETAIKQETYRVQRPVLTTEYRDTSYNVVRTVPETSYQEKRYTVSRPVWETAEREVWQTVQRPVQETVMQQRQYTVNRPVTTYQTEVVDRGQYVNYTAVEPGKKYHRLAWQSGGTYVDPVTGASRSQLPGLYWVPMQGEQKYKQETMYQPNYVTQQTPVTTLMPETVVEQIPVTQTRYQEERIARKEPYQVMRTIQEEKVEQIPVTTYRQVIERVQQTTPVQVYRLETQEVVRDVPVTTYKTITEEKTEQYTVKVPRIEQITRKVTKPYTVEKRIPLDQFGQPTTLPESSQGSALPEYQQPKLAPKTIETEPMPQGLGTTPQRTYAEPAGQKPEIPANTTPPTSPLGSGT